MVTPRTHRFRGRRRKPQGSTLDLFEAVEDSIILNIRQTSLSACAAKGLKVGCLCGFRVVRSGCMKKDCPVCGQEVTKRRARRIFDRFEKVRNGRPVLYTVLTVPPKVRSRFVVRSEWRKVVKAVIKVFKSEFGFDFGVECSHPISETNEYVFHPHINLLWLQKAGVDRHKSEIPGSIDLDKLRARWAQILGTAGPVDVNHQFAATEKKIRHRCRYIARVFPGLSSWVGSVRWYGKPPVLPPEIRKCPKCGQVFMVIDFLTEHEFLEERAIAAGVGWRDKIR